MRRIAVLWVISVLTACSNVTTLPPENYSMPSDAATISETATSCTSPFVATEKVDENFKYGCFCGRGHPGIEHSSGLPSDQLSAAERGDLVREYLKIRPIDSIDAACQAHDICWTQYGRSQLECNEAFSTELDRLQRVWSKRTSLFDTQSLDFRCKYMSRDISFATNSLMEGLSDDQAKLAATDIVKGIGVPITAFYAVLTYLGGVFGKNYPVAGEVCQEKSSSPFSE